MSLATKWRPIKWEDVIGQDSIVKILNQQISTNTIKNAYIFSGASGTGKTTSARLFANEINNHQGKPIEIDAASNSGVDNVRNIVANASERSLDSKYKVFIIDECHALSSQAWQAFLKCIEEPPKYTIFIFCSTESHKIPDTIKNRCMRFNFTRINSSLICERLKEISSAEGYLNFNDTCDYISRICNGEMRNAISMLEKCSDYGNMSINTAISCLGDFSYDTYFTLVNGIIDGNSKDVLNIINEVHNTGLDLTKFTNNFLEFCLDITKYILYDDIHKTKLPITVEDKVKYSISFENAKDYYFYIIEQLLETKNMIKDDLDVKSTIEVMFNKMCRLK